MNLNEIFPRASKDFLQANRASPGPEPERAFRDEPLGKAERKKAVPRRRILRITSFRTRPLDTDNLCPKYFIDALRMSGIIDDDTPKHIDLQVRQEKVRHRTEEKTTIEIEM